MVQVGHACHNAGNEFGIPKGHQPNLVVFEVENQQALIKVHEWLNYHDVKSVMFFEPDYDLGFTAISTEVLPETKKKLFKKYKLLV